MQGGGGEIRRKEDLSSWPHRHWSHEVMDGIEVEKTSLRGGVTGGGG